MNFVKNWIIFYLAIVFGLIETAYFGWNMFPHSNAEIICDGISILICALAFLDFSKTR